MSRIEELYSDAVYKIDILPSNIEYELIHEKERKYKLKVGVYWLEDIVVQEAVKKVYILHPIKKNWIKISEEKETVSRRTSTRGRFFELEYIVPDLKLSKNLYNTKLKLEISVRGYIPIPGKPPIIVNAIDEIGIIYDQGVEKEYGNKVTSAKVLDMSFTSGKMIEARKEDELLIKFSFEEPLPKGKNVSVIYLPRFDRPSFMYIPIMKVICREGVKEGFILTRVRHGFIKFEPWEIDVPKMGGLDIFTKFPILLLTVEYPKIIGVDFKVFTVYVRFPGKVFKPIPRLCPLDEILQMFEFSEKVYIPNKIVLANHPRWDYCKTINEESVCYVIYDLLFINEFGKGLNFVIDMYGLGYANRYYGFLSVKFFNQDKYNVLALIPPEKIEKYHAYIRVLNINGECAIPCNPLPKYREDMQSGRFWTISRFDLIGLGNENKVIEYSLIEFGYDSVYEYFPEGEGIPNKINISKIDVIPSELIRGKPFRTYISFDLDVSPIYNQIIDDFKIEIYDPMRRRYIDIFTAYDYLYLHKGFKKLNIMIGMLLPLLNFSGKTKMRIYIRLRKGVEASKEVGVVIK